MTIVTGDNSKREMFVTSEEYKLFLASDDNIDAWCDSEVDLWTLSYILDTTICSLSYNLVLDLLGAASSGASSKGNEFSKREVYFLASQTDPFTFSMII